MYHIIVLAIGPTQTPGCQVRLALEAKCVIKICMNDKVAEGARRLLDHAEHIRTKIDLRGCCLALDDCYEVWDSGFISIPYDFSIHELPEKMKMLKAGQKPPPGAPSTGMSSDGADSSSGQQRRTTAVRALPRSYAAVGVSGLGSQHSSAATAGASVPLTGFLGGLWFGAVCQNRRVCAPRRISACRPVLASAAPRASLPTSQRRCANSGRVLKL